MTRRRLLGMVFLGALAIAITACAEIAPPGGGQTDLDRDPRRIDAPAPDYAGPEIALPPPFDQAGVFDPGWDVPPQESQGVYLAPLVDDDRVTFTAVSEEGTVLWTAERPMLCSAFVVTASDDGPVAVLMDITAGKYTMSETTVSAYDLRTGAQRWGPVDVPGPHLGPGLVFAAPPLAAMGESGPRLALDSATGNPIIDESKDTGMTILGERDGIVLVAQGNRLIARTAEDSELWSLPIHDLKQSPDDLRALSGVPGDKVLALLGDPAVGATLVNLAQGTIMAHGMHGGVLDRSTGIRILHGDRLRAIDAAGNVLWERVVPAEAVLVSAGGGAGYLRSEGSVEVFEVLSGHATMSISSDAQAPRQITESGAGIIGSYSRPLLAVPAR